MTDNLSIEHRKKNMTAIRSVSKLEDKICSVLWATGIRFRRNVRSLFGNPDIAIQKYMVVIFIDSCYWHGCDAHGNMPKSNTEYWLAKLVRNKQRDVAVTEYYLSKGWNILRLWEHDFKKGSFESTIIRIYQFIKEAKSKQKSRT